MRLPCLGASDNFFEGDFLNDRKRIRYQTISGLDLNQRPLEDIEEIKTNSERLSVRIKAGVSVKFLKNFKFKSLFGYTKSQTNSSTFIGPNHTYVKSYVARAIEENEGIKTFLIPLGVGRLSRRNNRTTIWSLRNLLNYNASFSKHQISAFIGNEVNSRTAESDNSTFWGYNEKTGSFVRIDDQRIRDLDNIRINSVSQGSLGENFDRRKSFFGNFGYTYDKKYNISGSIRKDESLLFGKDKSAQNRPIWSVGGKWHIAKESFFNVDKINYLALRTTYGITGNSPRAGTASSFNVFNFTKFLQSDGFSGQEATIRTPANPKLTWEETKTINIGIDFGVLDNNRISGSIDMYRRRTTNLIGRQDVNPLTGFTTVSGNFGDIENKGIELQLNTINVNTNNFIWETSIAAGYNKNVLQKLNREFPRVSSLVSSNIVVGYPTGALFVYDFVGLDEKGDPQIRKKDGTITAKKGEAEVEDLIYAGTTTPPYGVGFNNFFKYKNFELRANIITQFGGAFRRRAYADITYSARLLLNFQNQSVEYLNQWQKPGDEKVTNIPRYAFNFSEDDREIQYFLASNYTVNDSDYAKLRDITLAYNLPPEVVSKLKMKSLRVTAQMNNILLWTANDFGFDPDEYSENIFNHRNSFSLSIQATF